MNVVIALGFFIINVTSVYCHEENLRMHMNLQRLSEKEIEKTEKLLTQMMPPNVLENLKEGRPATDRIFQVTLLYADIVGFTA